MKPAHDDPDAKCGRDFNDLLGTDSAEEIAALIEGGDTAPSIAPETASEQPSIAPQAWGFDVKELNQRFALTIWGGKAVVVNEQQDGPISDRVRVMTLEAMNSWFANRPTQILGSDGNIKVVSWCKAWHTHRKRRSYPGVQFFPNPDGAPGASGYYNFWKGFSVLPDRAGSYEIFQHHLLANVCNGDKDLHRYLFAWMAHIVQKPRDRIGIALVLRGRKGTGKSKVGEVLGSLLGSHYYQVDDARYITGQFNSHMMSCLLLQADEAVWAGDKSAEGRLKGLITSRRQMIEAKGVDPVQVDNYVRVIMTSNESWVVPASADERRFFVLDVGNACEQDNRYFAEMDEQLDNGGREKLLYDLQNFDLTDVNLWEVPKTKALLDQKVRSLDPIDQFWFERLHQGEMLDGAEWPEKIVCSRLYDDYLKFAGRLGVSRRRGDAEFGARIVKLAPSIRKHRPSIETDQPGVMRRTYCYVLPNLQECRAEFDRTIGHAVDWPASSGESDRSEKISDVSVYVVQGS